MKGHQGKKKLSIKERQDKKKEKLQRKQQDQDTSTEE